ncbi:class I SAM-dependent methyltransferase [Hydrogenibacillus schlegelii]|uniref:Protein-L-isoD(D-D) O-methyltransferase n=1 Tax=Hydrogenibacillus schlegelii TaxID=1484 RepID=A0A132N937_HYDSH|nr:hypothetical protein TR75_05650 [Hydrogenibacillus schlegelii]OAR05547.1 hypothetical protein SA87_11755 [Hydrogenibacillus schlegelii]
MSVTERYFFTTALEADRETLRAARALAERYGLPFVPRKKRSLRSLVEERQADGAFVYGADGLRLVDSDGGETRFHPGTAAVRIKRLRAGETDPMVEFARLAAGDRVLDATAGLLHDALVAAYAVGPEGEVVAVEKSLPLYILSDAAVRRPPDHPPAVREALRRIRLVHGDHRAVLEAMPARSVDVVLFDPMFRRPVARSLTSNRPLYRFGAPDSLSPEAYRAALRVARKAVVVKERPEAEVFRRFGLEVLPRKASFTFGRRLVGAAAVPEGERR